MKELKTVTKRDFCHKVTTYLKEKEDLEIIGRAFSATLTFNEDMFEELGDRISNLE